jgi:hypothetical protein
LQDCQCESVEVTVNQKCYVTSSNFNTAPTWFGLGGFLGAYQWKPTGLEQWCMGGFKPNLNDYGTSIRVLSYQLPPAPSAMPGRYVNGDVPSTLDLKTGIIKPALIGALFTSRNYTLINYSSDEKSPLPGNNYDWDNTHTQLRGAGGQPTTPCEGSPI